MINVNVMSKAALIEACRKLGFKTGDTARNSKEYYVGMLADADPATVEEVLSAFAPVAAGVIPAAAMIVSAPARRAEIDQPKVVGQKSAKELFGLNLKVLDGSPLMLDVWNDPDAPEINTTFRFNAKTLQKVLVCIAKGSNAWLSGPKGTGKTEFVLQLAARLGRSVARVNFDASAEKYEFLGGERVRAGSTVWQDGAILCGMRRAGCIVLLDELARARPEYLMALNPILEPRGRVTITETGEVVGKAAGVVFIAADNSNGTGDPTGQYVCRKLDDSLVDRFSAMVEFDYFEPAVEAGIIVDVTGCSAALAFELVKFIGVCRTAATAGNVETAPGLRQLFAWSEQILGGVEPREAYATAVVAKAGVESREELEQLFKQNCDPKRLTAAALDKLAEFDAEIAAKAAAAAAPAAPAAPDEPLPF